MDLKEKIDGRYMHTYTVLLDLNQLKFGYVSVMHTYILCIFTFSFLHVMPLDLDFVNLHGTLSFLTGRLTV